MKSFLSRYKLAITICALAATAVVYLLVKIVKKIWDWLHPLQLVPVKDDGEQHVAPSPLVFALELYPVRDPGDQELDKVGQLVEHGGG